ncbi:MAG TPA: hypothetical protein VJI96_00780 [Candidatus Andersenbacteria bacterium]|nr:hypothetical protein [Candidatus Andersenbacteria bacterium]
MKKRASEQAGYPPEAKLVCDMLGGNTNPLVSVTFIERPNPIIKKSIGCPRSMGFIVERFEKGLRLVATCKHAISFFSMSAYTNLVAFKNPKVTSLQCIGNPIGDPERESDIAFLLVRDPLDAPTQPFALHAEELRIVDGMTLYNAQNQCNPVTSTYNVPVAAQSVEDRKQIVFCKLSEKDTHIVSIENTDKRLQFEQQGFVGYRALSMVSRPGFSGSPIWDNQLRLYGMDVRGSSPKDTFYTDMGDFTVCLPTSAIHAARQRIDLSLQRLLARA